MSRFSETGQRFRHAHATPRTSVAEVADRFASDHQLLSLQPVAHSGNLPRADPAGVQSPQSLKFCLYSPGKSSPVAAVVGEQIHKNSVGEDRVRPTRSDQVGHTRKVPAELFGLARAWNQPQPNMRPADEYLIRFDKRPAQPNWVQAMSFPVGAKGRL